MSLPVLRTNRCETVDAWIGRRLGRGHEPLARSDLTTSSERPRCDRRQRWRSSGAVTLRDVVESDLQTFYRRQSDPVSIEMAQVTPRDKAAYLARWTQFLANESFGKRTIVVDGVVAGQVISFDRNGVRELGYWLCREFWGQGIAGAAVQKYLAFKPRRPLFANVAEHNTASRRM